MAVVIRNVTTLPLTAVRLAFRVVSIVILLRKTWFQVHTIVAVSPTQHQSGRMASQLRMLGCLLMCWYLS